MSGTDSVGPRVTCLAAAWRQRGLWLCAGVLQVTLLPVHGGGCFFPVPLICFFLLGLFQRHLAFTTCNLSAWAVR